MGPGPSDVDTRVLEALARPTIGHLDPAFIEILDQIRELLQYTFQTKNQMTLAMSGTGSAGMETCVVNLIEPGDEMLVCINGVFGNRMVDVAQRYGATVHRIETEWGRHLRKHKILKAGLSALGISYVSQEGHCLPMLNAVAFPRVLTT